MRLPGGLLLAALNHYSKLSPAALVSLSGASSTLSTSEAGHERRNFNGSSDGACSANHSRRRYVGIGSQHFTGVPSMQISQPARTMSESRAKRRGHVISALHYRSCGNRKAMRAAMNLSMCEKLNQLYFLGECPF